ncbi:sensor histidine kinase [Methyloversatilis sp.]|uniref:sensor histidine kinase n=1 Tax=Methyloversatilis sp. TaxID=2569862 RepID=UPI002736CD36|nr:histidine kinase [Methyloversatilis sp.]MDP2870050.1 histidine kinase [Methyloversatilis sp.]MDP3288159.1 histidine kinase [Methyloversatilis sp.]MDP3454026.1 histidine kinase [Methyloversatilis sp.]MDP3576577.1 histidine kinase [Methyloversatilis sp.]
MKSTYIRKHRHQIELALIVATAAITFVASSQAELYERFHTQLTRYEVVQADELFIALLGLTVALTVFSFMRWRDARHELASRVAVERRLKLLVTRNRELAQALIGLQEAERRRFAHELHDHFGQCCNAIRIDAVFLRDHLANPSPEKRAADRIAESADDLYQTVRGLLYELRPASLDSLGLLGAVQSLCESWEERSTINCALLPRGDLDELGEDANIAIFRIIQESLSNVMKHANASHVRIVLGHHADTDTIELVIEDDGGGYDAVRVRPGLGWLGMGERASMLGGALKIGKSSLGGVMVSCSFRHPAHADANEPHKVKDHD